MSFSKTFAEGFNVGRGAVTSVAEGMRKADERIAKENAEKKMLALFKKHGGNLSRIDMASEVGSVEELQALAGLTKTLSSTEEGREAMKKLADARAVEGIKKIKAALSLVDQKVQTGDMDGAAQALEWAGRVTPTSTSIKRTGGGRVAIIRPNIATGEYETLQEGSVAEVRATVNQMLMDEPKLREGFILEQIAEQDANPDIMNDPSKWLYDDEGNPFVQQYNVLNGGIRFLDPRTLQYVDTAGKNLMPWDKRMDAKREQRAEANARLNRAATIQDMQQQREKAAYARSQRPQEERRVGLKLQAAEQELAAGGYNPTNDARQLREYQDIVTQAQDPSEIFMAAKTYGVLQEVKNDMDAVTGYFAPIPGGRVLFDGEGNYVRAEGSEQFGQQQASAGAGTRSAPQGVQDGTIFRDKQSGTKYYVKGGMAYPMD